MASFESAAAALGASFGQLAAEQGVAAAYCLSTKEDSSVGSTSDAPERLAAIARQDAGAALFTETETVHAVLVAETVRQDGGQSLVGAFAVAIAGVGASEDREFARSVVVAAGYECPNAPDLGALGRGTVVDND
jgi:hypothetical protein